MTGGEPSTGLPARGALALGPRCDLFLRITPQHTPLLVRLQSTDCFPWNEAPLKARHWRHGSRGPLLPPPPTRCEGHICHEEVTSVQDSTHKMVKITELSSTLSCATLVNY